MAEKLSKNLVSPARQLEQRLMDLDAQHYATKGWEVLPEHAGPMPTLYNVNTGEWDEVTPTQGKLLGVPIGKPVDSRVLSRMWRGGPEYPGTAPWWLNKESTT